MTGETKAEREERFCTCGAGHGSLEGHVYWCEWREHRPLTAPDHIRGPLSRYTDPNIIQARIEWVREAQDAGHAVPEIARALGISMTGVRRLSLPKDRGDMFTRRRKPRLLSPWGRGGMWRDFTPDQRSDLYRYAEKYGCESPSDLINEVVREWLAAENAKASE